MNRIALRSLFLVFSLGLISCGKSTIDFSKFKVKNISALKSIGFGSVGSYSSQNKAKIKKRTIINSNTDVSISDKPFLLLSQDKNNVLSSLLLNEDVGDIDIQSFLALDNFYLFVPGSQTSSGRYVMIDNNQNQPPVDSKEMFSYLWSGINLDDGRSQYCISKSTGKIYDFSFIRGDTWYSMGDFTYYIGGDPLNLYSLEEINDELIIKKIVSQDIIGGINGMDINGNLYTINNSIISSKDHKNHLISSYFDGNCSVKIDPVYRVSYLIYDDKYYVISSEGNPVLYDGTIGMTEKKDGTYYGPSLGTLLYSEGLYSYYFIKQYYSGIVDPNFPDKLYTGTLCRITRNNNDMSYIAEYYPLSFDGYDSYLRGNKVYYRNNSLFYYYDLVNLKEELIDTKGYSISSISEDDMDNIIVSGYDDSFNKFTGYLDEDNNVVFTPINDTQGYEVIHLSPLN